MLKIMKATMILIYHMELSKKQLSEKVVFHHEKRLYFDCLTASLIYKNSHEINK
jgi:hypothetical protein